MSEDNKPGFKESLKEALQYMGPALVASLSSKDPMDAYRAYNTALQQKRADEQLELNRQAAIQRQERAGESIDLQLQKMQLRQLEFGLQKQAEQRRAKKLDVDIEEKGSLTGKQTEKLANYNEILANLNILEKLGGQVDTGPFAGRVQAVQSFLGIGDTDMFDQLRTAQTVVSANYRKSVSGAAVSDQEREVLRKAIPDITDNDERFMNKLKTFRKLTEVGGEEFLKAIASGQPLKKELASKLLDQIPNSDKLEAGMMTFKEKLTDFETRQKK